MQEPVLLQQAASVLLPWWVSVREPVLLQQAVFASLPERAQAPVQAWLQQVAFGQQEKWSVWQVVPAQQSEAWEQERPPRRELLVLQFPQEQGAGEQGALS